MLSSVPARLALSPILIAQAIRVRRRAIVLPEPTGPRRGVAGSGPMLRLLIAGDSSAAGVGVAHQDLALSGQLVSALAPHFSVHWRLEAHTGDTTAQTLAKLSALTPEPVDVAVTALGVNDVTHQRPLRRWLAEQREISALLQDHWGVRAQWRSGVPPMGVFPLLPRPLRDVLGAQAARFDRALAGASTGPVHYLPFDRSRLDPSMMAADGFHPGADVYAAWGQELGKLIAAWGAARSDGIA